VEAVRRPARGGGRAPRYSPEGQAIAATHFEVVSLRPLDTTVPIDVALGEEKARSGRFVIYTWPEGTKLEGESATQFVADGGATYWLAARPGNLPPIGTTVTIRAREVEPSPFVSRPGGPYLWVVAFECGTEPRPCWRAAEYGKVP